MPLPSIAKIAITMTFLITLVICFVWPLPRAVTIAKR
jgi:hypothetical protein